MTADSLEQYFRTTERKWRIGVLNGPNLSNLHRMASHRFGKNSDIDSIESLGERVSNLASLLNVELEWFVNNHDGEILEWIHAAPDRLDGIIINPGGLTMYGAGARQALLDTDLPVIECHLANLGKQNRQSIFTPTVIGQIHGFKQHSYTAALVAMVATLDSQ